MSFAVQPTDRVQPEIRRVAAECLDRAIAELDGLDGKTPADIEDAVHGVRKRGKEVRALARLVRSPLKSKWRPFNDLVRDASDELSALRDAHAVLATLDDLRLATRLEEDDDLGVVRTTQAAVALAATENVQAGDPRIARAHGLLVEAREQVDHWKIPRGSEWLVDGVADTYRSGRRDLRRARKNPTDARLHAWRKRVKTLWYQMRLVEAAAPSVLTPLVGELDDLAEALGDDHDLAVLVERLRSDPRRFGGKKPVKKAVAAARAQQDDLRQRAFRLGASLYAEPTSAFVDRIDRYWETTLHVGPELPTGGIAELLADEKSGPSKPDPAGSQPPASSLELERKFLVTSLPGLDDEGTSFRQGYLAIDGSVALRVRDAGHKGCTLTVKAGRGAVRTELEWVISREQFDRLWPATLDRRIEKVRHHVPLSSPVPDDRQLIVDLDLFHGELEGLVLAEVEFDSDEAMERFSPPEWFGEEVTEDVAYTNASLSTGAVRP